MRRTEEEQEYIVQPVQKIKDIVMIVDVFAASKLWVVWKFGELTLI